MSIKDRPISEREGFRQMLRPDSLQRELAAISRKYGLLGFVFIQFTGERVGARSWGVTDEFLKAMTALGDRILTDIDDGRHEPLEFIEPDGQA